MKLDHRLRKVASALYCSLDTPRALTCMILMRHEEWGQLVTLSVDPANYLSGSSGAQSFRKDAQATDFLRKSPLVPSKVDLTAAAERSFIDSENQCHHTNEFLRLLQFPSISDPEIFGRIRSILDRARKIATRVLGPVPPSLDGRFGPGTAFELKGQAYTTLADKLWITPHATQSCMSLFEHMYWPTLWGRKRLELGLPLPAQCRGNRFSTVPKDATKHRGICIEPLGNLWVQLAVGGYMKRRLAAVGLKVSRSALPDCPIQRLRTRPSLTGQDIHQRLARDGSLDERWATIDLSNASDTVCLELVRWVLPPDWFELLFACRSSHTLFKKKWVLLDKFSSMGNGATFELETLVFASILEAATGARMGSDLFVYGDDIVIPQEKGRDALAVLTACGFQANTKKTFLSGPFRESCGGDFFSGFSVRAYFSKGKLNSPLEWISMHNQLKERWPLATVALQRCIEAVPLKLRCFGPSFLGDRVFHGPPKRVWEQDGCTWVATVCSTPSALPLDRWGTEFISCLAVLGSQSSGLVPRDSELSYRLSKASIS